VQKIQAQQQKLQDAGLRVVPAKPSFMEHVVEAAQRQVLVEEAAAAKVQGEKEVKQKIKAIQKKKMVKKVRPATQAVCCDSTTVHLSVSVAICCQVHILIYFCRVRLLSAFHIRRVHSPGTFDAIRTSALVRSSLVNKRSTGRTALSIL
jgi:hypothetical protein